MSLGGSRETLGQRSNCSCQSCLRWPNRASRRPQGCPWWAPSATGRDWSSQRSRRCDGRRKTCSAARRTSPTAEQSGSPSRRWSMRWSQRSVPELRQPALFQERRLAAPAWGSSVASAVRRVPGRPQRRPERVLPGSHAQRHCCEDLLATLRQTGVVTSPQQASLPSPAVMCALLQDLQGSFVRLAVHWRSKLHAEVLGGE